MRARHAARVIVAAGFAACAWTGPAQAQVSSDSLAERTRVLQTGSLGERAGAAGKIARVPASELPAGTRSALIAELRRLNDLIVADRLGAEYPEQDDAVSDYYMALVPLVASLETPDAYRALIPSIGVSKGIARRVAQLGDEGVAAVADLVGRGYEEANGITTLGLAWFWADSTGAALSDESRATIVRVLDSAFASDSFPLQLGLAGALEATADPGLLPMAVALRDRQAGGDAAFRALGRITGRAVRKLEAVAGSASVTAAAGRTRRLIAAICRDASPSRRLGACQSISSAFDAAMSHIGSGQTAAARAELENVVRLADAALASGDITSAEHSTIAGGASQLLRRLTP